MVAALSDLPHQKRFLEISLGVVNSVSCSLFANELGVKQICQAS